MKVEESGNENVYNGVPSDRAPGKMKDDDKSERKER